MIQSLLRSLDLLEALKDGGKQFSISELSELLQLPPSTIHRILQTFCSKNYVTKDEKTHLYQLGPALISLGMTAAHHIKLQSVSLPILQKLSNYTGEDAFLMIRVGMKGLILEKVEGPNNFKVVDHFGYELGLHCGAIRKVLLAYQSNEFLQEYMAHGLIPHRANITTDPKELRKNLDKIRQEGISVSYSEYIQDAIGVGAPVFDANGNIAASIGIIVPASRTDNEHLSILKSSVKECAETLSYRMGYTICTSKIIEKLNN